MQFVFGTRTFRLGRSAFGANPSPKAPPVPTSAVAPGYYPGEGTADMDAATRYSTGKIPGSKGVVRLGLDGSQVSSPLDAYIWLPSQTKATLNEIADYGRRQVAVVVAFDRWTGIYRARGDSGDGLTASYIDRTYGGAPPVSTTPESTVDDVLGDVDDVLGDVDILVEGGDSTGDDSTGDDSTGDTEAAGESGDLTFTEKTSLVGLAILLAGTLFRAFRR